MTATAHVKHWLTTTNHKDVGILYLWTSLVFFVVGGFLALLIRTQLAVPDNDFLSPRTYNQVMTMHGLVMIFFFIVPLGFAFANYFVPIHIGAPDMAFPRVNAISYWLFVAGGIVAVSGFLVGNAADGAWTFYTPLSRRPYTPAVGVDLAAIGIILFGASTTVSTVNFLVTILRWRAPGISLYQMPLYTWAILFTTILNLIVYPVIGVAFLMLLADRNFGTDFFSPGVEGTTLWQHFFWFFGHPEVYIVLFPGLGALLETIPVFARRPIYGRRFILIALAVATGISLIVWMHHMFVAGIDPTLRKFFTFTTELISIPFGVIYLCLIATLWKGSVRFRSAMLFSLAFLFLFLIGGLTGVFLSSAALDYDFRGTYYVVAHFHYTFAGGALMGLLAGLYYWFPKMTGRFMSERVGHASFWLAVVGANLIWLAQFAIREMPRRIVSYEPETGWGTANLVSTIGAYVFGLAMVLTLFNALWSWRRGAPAGANPWGGESLEWTLPSPPPPHNFEVPPALRTRERGK